LISRIKHLFGGCIKNQQPPEQLLLSPGKCN